MMRLANALLLILWLGLFAYNVYADDDMSWRKRYIVCLYNADSSSKVNFHPSMIDPSLCTHINYEFAKLGDNSTYIMPASSAELQQYKELTDLKTRSPQLKIYLSLGGWADSTVKYSILVNDQKIRRMFIENAKAYLKNHGFDGMDVSWQYPNAWQGRIGANPKDRDNYPIFLKEMKEAFEKEKYEISCSVAAYEEEIKAAYNIPAISAVVHHINVMTYDMHGAWAKGVNHHAQFKARSNSNDNLEKELNFKKSVEYWAEHGGDRIKLIPGIAGYGTTFTLATENHDVGAPHKGKGRPGPQTKRWGYLSFGEICDFIHKEKWTRVEDPEVGDYAYKDDQWVGYDDLINIVRKVKFLIDNKFGGVHFKSIDSDDFRGNCYNRTKFPLILTIKEELIKREKADKI